MIKRTNNQLSQRLIVYCQNVIRWGKECQPKSLEIASRYGKFYASNKLFKVIHKYVCIEFPSGCISYNPPHTLDCYEAIWEKAGCIDEGTEQPQTMLPETKDFFDQSNLKYLLCYFH